MLAFTPEITEQIGYYVYRLIDPRDNKTFYVGKGKGNRVFAHVAEALAGARDTPKLGRIRDIHATGLQVGHIIHRHGMSEKEAFLLEAALIDAYQEFIGEDLHNAVEGQHSRLTGVMSAEDMISIYAAEPVEIVDPVIIININREWYPSMPADELYQYTRCSWVCRPERHKDCRYALSVKNGVIRQVYAIKSWHLDPRFAGQDKKRWMFEGAVATDKAQYLHKSIRHLIKRGAANPIRWVGC